MHRDLSDLPPLGVCGCGCGLRTPIASHNDASKGWIKGQPLRYLRYHWTKSQLRRPDDAEQKKAYFADWEEKNRKKRSLQRRARYIAKRDELLRQAKEYRLSHAAKRKQICARWAKANAAKMNTYYQKRRAKCGSESHTVTQWLALLESCDHRCLCCLKQEPEVKLTRDHVVPLKFGGSNTIKNIQPLCDHCNKSKGTKTIDYRPHSALTQTDSNQPTLAELTTAIFWHAEIASSNDSPASGTNAASSMNSAVG